MKLSSYSFRHRVLALAFTALCASATSGWAVNNLAYYHGTSDTDDVDDSDTTVSVTTVSVSSVSVSSGGSSGATITNGGSLSIVNSGINYYGGSSSVSLSGSTYYGGSAAVISSSEPYNYATAAISAVTSAEAAGVPAKFDAAKFTAGGILTLGNANVGSYSYRPLSNTSVSTSTTVSPLTFTDGSSLNFPYGGRIGFPNGASITLPDGNIFTLMQNAEIAAAASSSIVLGTSGSKVQLAEGSKFIIAGSTQSMTIDEDGAVIDLDGVIPTASSTAATSLSGGSLYLVNGLTGSTTITENSTNSGTIVTILYANSAPAPKKYMLGGAVADLKIRPNADTGAVKIKAKVSVENLSSAALHDVTATLYISEDNTLDSTDFKVLTLNLADYFHKSKIRKGKTLEMSFHHKIPATLSAFLDGKYLLVQLSAKGVLPDDAELVVVGPITIP